MVPREGLRPGLVCRADLSQIVIIEQLPAAGCQKPGAACAETGKAGLFAAALLFNLKSGQLTAPRILLDAQRTLYDFEMTHVLYRPNEYI
jgi:hypothetical protein